MVIPSCILSLSLCLRSLLFLEFCDMTALDMRSCSMQTSMAPTLTFCAPMSYDVETWRILWSIWECVPFQHLACSLCFLGKIQTLCMSVNIGNFVAFRQDASRATSTMRHGSTERGHKQLSALFSMDPALMTSSSCGMGWQWFLGFHF